MSAHIRNCLHSCAVWLNFVNVIHITALCNWFQSHCGASVASTAQCFKRHVTFAHGVIFLTLPYLPFMWQFLFKNVFNQNQNQVFNQNQNLSKPAIGSSRRKSQLIMCIQDYRKSPPSVENQVFDLTYKLHWVHVGHSLSITSADSVCKPQLRSRRVFTCDVFLQEITDLSSTLKSEISCLWFEFHNFDNGFMSFRNIWITCGYSVCIWLLHGCQKYFTMWRNKCDNWEEVGPRRCWKFVGKRKGKKAKLIMELSANERLLM